MRAGGLPVADAGDGDAGVHRRVYRLLTEAFEDQPMGRGVTGLGLRQAASARR